VACHRFGLSRSAFPYAPARATSRHKLPPRDIRRGHLEFIANKKDFDYNVVLYEQTKSGQYILLAPYWTRASYNGHLGVRRLLTPGKRQRLDFEAVRLMGRQLQPGSRIVVVLSVIKETGRQINYGTGKDVSDETIADAKEPLTIRWLAASYIDLPLRR